jgi:hypothetical protein
MVTNQGRDDTLGGDDPRAADRDRRQRGDDDEPRAPVLVAISCWAVSGSAVLVAMLSFASMIARRGSRSTRIDPSRWCGRRATLSRCAVQERVSVFSVSAVDGERLEADLAAGRICCPGCGGSLSRWGFAREREVRMLDGMRSLRPRRAYCGSCATTHVIAPAWSVPRRRDGAEVIGEALLAKARGDGHRTIAARLGRPQATVRGWLRAFALRADAVERSALRWAHAIDAQFAPGRSAGSPLADAVDALGSAARACRVHLRAADGTWELAVMLTGGLLCGRLRDPPGF